MSINVKGYAIGLFVFVAASVALTPNYASAHEADQTNDPASSTEQQVEDYKFVTPAGGSLSELVRRALQLFDASNDGISLSEPQAMFAEANIVNALGARLLEIGEEITIHSSDIEQFTTQSQTLTNTQQANWKVYSDTADFEAVSTIVPQSAPGAEEPTDAAAGEQQAENVSDEDGDSGTSSNWWWAVAVAAIAGIAYFLVPGAQINKKS